MGIVLLAVWLPIYALSFVCIFMLSRNQKVYRYRQEINNKVYFACIADRLRGKNPDWRHDVYASVSYHQMVRKFWQKLDDFYPDKSFIKIDGDLEADLRARAKDYMQAKMPRYFKDDAKLNLDAGLEDVFMLLEIYMPVLADLKKDKV